MYFPDTLEGVVQFCENEGQPCDSVRRCGEVFMELLENEYGTGRGPNDTATRWIKRWLEATA